jgi:hypothetical protein
MSLYCYSYPLQLLPGHTVYKTKSIFSVVRANDFVFAHDPPPYDGKDELN